MCVFSLLLMHKLQLIYFFKVKCQNSSFWLLRLRSKLDLGESIALISMIKNYANVKSRMVKKIRSIFRMYFNQSYTNYVRYIFMISFIFNRISELPFL